MGCPVCFLHVNQNTFQFGKHQPPLKAIIHLHFLLRVSLTFQLNVNLIDTLVGLLYPSFVVRLDWFFGALDENFGVALILLLCLLLVAFSSAHQMTLLAHKIFNFLLQLANLGFIVFFFFNMFFFELFDVALKVLLDLAKDFIIVARWITILFFYDLHEVV